MLSSQQTTGYYRKTPHSTNNSSAYASPTRSSGHLGSSANGISLEHSPQQRKSSGMRKKNWMTNGHGMTEKNPMSQSLHSWPWRTVMKILLVFMSFSVFAYALIVAAGINIKLITHEISSNSHINSDETRLDLRQMLEFHGKEGLITSENHKFLNSEKINNLDYIRKNNGFNMEKGYKNNCSVLYFYHVPKTGGNSVRYILGDLIFRHMKRAQRIDFFSLNISMTHSYDLGNETLYKVWDTIRTMNDPKNSETPQYLNIHHHHRAHGLLEEFEFAFDPLRKEPQTMFMYEWIAAVRDYVINVKGCGFLSATMFRDPYTRTISHIGFTEQNEYPDVSTTPEMAKDLIDYYDDYEIRYFLKNFINSEFKVSLKDYLKTLEILNEIFDVIGLTSEHEDFYQILNEILKWPFSKARKEKGDKHNETFKKHKYIPDTNTSQYLMLKANQFDEALIRAIQHDLYPNSIPTKALSFFKQNKQQT